MSETTTYPKIDDVQNKDMLYQILPKYGFDVNKRRMDGNTPLKDVICCEREYLDCVEFLIAHGADVSVLDHKGDGLLYHAKKMKHWNIYKLLERTLIK